MMLNWKDTVLGYRARVKAQGPRECKDMVFSCREALIDARVEEVTLTISGHGSLWSEALHLLPAKAAEHGRYQRGFASTREAMEAFEVFVESLRAKESWVVGEIPL